LNPPWQQTQATQSRQLSNQSIIAAYVNRITDSLNRSARFLTKYSSRTKRRQEGGGEVAIEFTRKIQTHSTEANKSAFNPTVSFVKAQRSATNGIRASRVSRSSFDRHRTTERPHRDRVGDTVRAHKFASEGREGSRRPSRRRLHVHTLPYTSEATGSMKFWPNISLKISSSSSQHHCAVATLITTGSNIIMIISLVLSTVSRTFYRRRTIEFKTTSSASFVLCSN
jgi:site-specific DNA-cytosine methylase